jgi:YD repeat-containing protein
MAVVKPLYYVSNNLREMDTTMVGQIVDQAVYQYSLSPSVALSVVSSSGTLSAINDTRKSAGAQSTSSTSFPGEGTTQEPQTVTVTYDKVTETRTAGSPTADTGKTWPVYYNGSGQIQAMTLTDVKDTFLHPAIDLLASGSTGTQQGGTYHVSTSTSVSGSTEVSGANTAIFTDTRADTGAYAAGDIPETQDQPTTITNYYLHKITGAAISYTEPYFLDGSNNIKEFTAAAFNSLLQEWMQYTAVSSGDGYSLSYNIGSSGSGNTRGSGMADTILNGSGNYQTRQVNNDDYRAQEFPDGSATTAATYYLRINKS